MARPTLLCVDDDSASRTLYRHLLGSYGYDVVLAEDAVQALHTLERSSVNAVLLDYEMPGMNGSEVAAVIKHRTPKMPIIMVSGCSSVVEDAPRFVDAAVAKGAPIEKLLGLLHGLVPQGGGGAAAAPLTSARYVPLGTALATAALLAYLLPLLWR
jgi:CheY-like chemotaxis protein